MSFETSLHQTEITALIVVTERDRAESLVYIESSMREAFGCDPPPTQGIVCIAREKNTIVGSLVLQNTKSKVPFPIEEHYAFDPANAPFPFDREDMLQANRWTALRPGVSLLVVQTCAYLARNLGKRYLLIEAKPYSAERLCALGFDCRAIAGTTLLPEKAREFVGDAGMRFYEEEPLPTLYMLPI